MNKKRNRMNLLIMIIIIVVVDLVFIGYNAIKKHDNGAISNNNSAVVRIINQSPILKG